MKTILIKTDNTVQVVEVQKNSGWEEFQRITGQGWTEYVRTTEGLVMLCDEEGLLKRLKINELASRLYGVKEAYIVGDVLLGKFVMTQDGPDFSFFGDEEVSDVYWKLRGFAAICKGKFTFIKEEEDGRK